MIKKSICIKNFLDRSPSGDTWNTITGLTDDNIIVRYTGETEDNAYIAKFNIHLTQNIDDIGMFEQAALEWQQYKQYFEGEYVLYNNISYVCSENHISAQSFDYNKWDITVISNDSTEVIFTGETKINQFRRYGKTESDTDLYNPVWNSGFTQEILFPNGALGKIIKEKTKPSSDYVQNLYDYDIWQSGDTGSTISYHDISKIESEISYISKGLNYKNSINTPKIKLDYLTGVIFPPRIDVDVYIDRGINSSFDRHVKLSEIKSVNDLENYGNGYYKIKES